MTATVATGRGVLTASWGWPCEADQITHAFGWHEANAGVHMDMHMCSSMHYASTYVCGVQGTRGDPNTTVSRCRCGWICS